MINIDLKVELSGLIDTRNAVYTIYDDQYNVVRIKYPNNDILYGPYKNVDEAFIALSEKNKNGMDALVLGKTVGVVNDNRIVEYWFKENCETITDLVPKTFESGISNTDIEALTDVQILSLFNKIFLNDGYSISR